MSSWSFNSRSQIAAVSLAPRVNTVGSICPAHKRQPYSPWRRTSYGRRMSGNPRAPCLSPSRSLAAGRSPSCRPSRNCGESVYPAELSEIHPAVPSKRQQGTCFVKVAPPGMSQPPSSTHSVYCATL
jgi:hypothetical protein